MICLHDWELGMFRFLSGQVFFFEAKSISLILLEKGDSTFLSSCNGLTRVFFSLLFLLYSYFLAFLPTQCYKSCTIWEKAITNEVLINIYICKATRKSINNFFLGLCTSVTCIVFETVFLESKSVQWVPVFFRFAEPNSVEYTPVGWSRDSTQSRGGRNITHNTVGTNFNLSLSVNLTPH